MNLRIRPEIPPPQAGTGARGPRPPRSRPLAPAAAIDNDASDVLKEIRMLVLWLVGALVVSSAIVVGFWLKVEDSPK
jgi:hypothetical protein